MSSENEMFAKRFPEKVGHVGTHYPECYKVHPSCAWRAGFEDGLADAAERAESHMQTLPLRVARALEDNGNTQENPND